MNVQLSNNEPVVMSGMIFSAVSGSHMQGGTISFKAKEKHADGWTVDFKYKSAFVDQYYTDYFYWSCFTGYCGEEISHIRNQLVSNSTTYPSPWVQYESHMKKRVYDDKPFQLWESSCCWVSNINYVDGWQLITSVDLGIRSDTKQPNSSPVTTIIPIIRIPQNCATNISLLAYDPNGDAVRCRYGYNYGECARCVQNFYLDEQICVMYVPSQTTKGFYVQELILEDYPNNDIRIMYKDGTVSYKSRAPPRNLPQNISSYIYPTTGEPSTDINSTEATTQPITQESLTYSSSVNPSSLSKISLQFIVEVTDPIPTCTFALHRPKFVPPTPNPGERLLTHVGFPFQLHLGALVTFDLLIDFKVSGPVGLTKSPVTLYEFNTRGMTVTWTPGNDYLGDHVPFCFVAETRNGYQSELRCIIVVVGPTKLVNSTLTCHENTMTLIVPKLPYNELYENNFHLNDPKCLATSNSTHLIASVAYNTCGTETEETEDNIVFKNQLFSYDDINSVITRKHGVSIPFNCSFPKKTNVSASFRARKLDYVFEEAGFGNFTYKFQFYTTDRFVQLVTDYPVDVLLRDLLYMEIQVTSSVPNVQLFVESCRATPHDNPNDPVFYDIIKNGCIGDDTMKTYSGAVTQYRFSLEAFAFIGNYDEVYISCTVILCKMGDSNTRCAKGCLAGSGGNRRRRSLASESQQHFISQGPLRMKRSSPSNTEDSNSLNMNTLVVALSGVVIVAMVAVTVHMYVKKARSAGYERLAAQDC